MRLAVAAALLGLLFSVPAVARADSFDPLSIGLHVSTLGDGVTLERPLLFNLSARIDTGLLSQSSQQNYDHNPWESTFHENNVLVAMDWRPYAGRWRLSGGLLFGGDYVEKVAQSVNSTYVLNGDTYASNAAGVVSAHVSFARPSIYLGFGGGTGILKGLTIAFDAGPPSMRVSWCATARPRPAPPVRSKPIRSSKPTSPPPRPNSARASSSRSSASASSIVPEHRRYVFAPAPIDS
jgi:hypothetical protein